MAAEPSDPCPFCRIARHEERASILAEDDAAMAFLDIRPVAVGHALVIPKAHAAFLADLPKELGARLLPMAMEVAAALRRSGLPCEGVNIHVADGAVAGQVIFHVHLHVIPRTRGDGFGLRMGPHYGAMPSREELDQVAARIRNAAPSGPR